MKTAELREAYLAFFESKGHRRVASSSLIPHDDPTLLFTNAGMNQFKDPLLGRSDPGYRRATSSQRCVRAGGKHNDLENVGFTARHLTFFEMLGNFSFGEYFKEDTISWAWEFVTQVLKLPEEKIWVTVHPSDDESRAYWIDTIGLPAERVIDLEENFWTMGDTGPCGPCTELFYDHGPEVQGGPPGSPDEDGDRYIEFWNLVFPQFDRAPDGKLTPLPQPGVDTGMGLERITAILQGVHSVYEIDLFAKLMLAAGQFAGITNTQDVLANASLRVIADHIRSSAFLIADGIAPGNEDRAYVLRRIIRRALRHGHKLAIEGPFFHKLVRVLVEEMGDAYPLLQERERHIASALEQEEIRFGETLNQGMSVLTARLDELQGDMLPGDTVFELYDTYGFPVDLTADIVREKGLDVDLAGFEAAMEKQRERGRAGASFSTSLSQRIHVAEAIEFRGYDELDSDAEVLATFDSEGDPLKALNAGDDGVVVLNRTSFYAQAGGQVGDRGRLVANAGDTIFRVDDTLVSGDQSLHVGCLEQGTLKPGSAVKATVDAGYREGVKRNHSATHLLHATLRKMLGDHVQQKGSLVTHDRLRFDFSHDAALSHGEMVNIERKVNELILGNTAVGTEVMDFEDATEAGAMALFGEKYDDRVRVLTMGDGYSVELCGGTHVKRTGDIGLFKLTSESGIAAGVRRIEAVTGIGALDYVRNTQNIVERLEAELKTPRQELSERVSGLARENRELQRALEQQARQLASDTGSHLADQAIKVGDIHFVAAKVQGDAKAMMQTLDSLRSKYSRGVFVLATQADEKLNAVVGISRELNDRMTAPDLMQRVGATMGLKGGGRPDMARAGGSVPQGDLDAVLETAFADARAVVENTFG